jgi:transposase
MADQFGVSVRTVHKGLGRYRAGGQGARGNGASAPVRRPTRLGKDRIALILDLRRRVRMTMAVIAAQLGLRRDRPILRRAQPRPAAMA